MDQLLARMVVFPWRIQDRDTGRLIYCSNDSMFAAPKYERGHENFFQKISQEGWSTCPNGYAVYARSMPGLAGSLFIIHGLKVPGYSTAQGKGDGLTIRLDSKTVEKNVNLWLESIKSINEKILSMLVEGIHEIRSVNSALYHASYRLQGLIQNTGLSESLSRNVTALSELISARINLIDAMASEGEDEEGEVKGIVIFKKFEKIYKCFIALGKSRGVAVSLEGESYANIRGSDYTDLIPLLLMDNAVKYSPENKSVKIAISEDNETVHCRVDSWGPKIEKEELARIFDRGFRGRHAVDSGRAGGGIGLYFLRKLVRNANGEILVKQSSNCHTKNGTPYCETSFLIDFPIYR